MIGAMDCASAGGREVEAVKGQQATMRPSAEGVNRPMLMLRS